MGKSAARPSDESKVEAKREELRAAIREANELLSDLKQVKKDIGHLVHSRIQGHLDAHIKAAREEINRKLDEFTKSLAEHSDNFQQALMERWAHIEAMCLADSKMAGLIAMWIMRQETSGTVDTISAKYHLVKEEVEEDGSPSFSFPTALAWRAGINPDVADAIRDAVAEHVPDADLMLQTTTFLKGPNDQ